MLSKLNSIPEQVRQEVLEKAAASCCTENQSEAQCAVEKCAGEIVVQTLVASEVNAAYISRNALKQLLVDAIRAARCHSERSRVSGTVSNCNGRNCLAV